MGMMGMPGLGNNPGKGTRCQGCLRIFNCKKLKKFKESSKITDLCTSAQYSVGIAHRLYSGVKKGD